MGRAIGMTGPGAARRRTDEKEVEELLSPDVELARLRRLMDQLQSFAAHWDVPPGRELHVDLRMAMSLARWPGRYWH